MIGYIAEADGSPCPTLVLNQELLPHDEEPLTTLLRAARGWMRSGGLDNVLKIAMVSPSRHPLFDLDYRFVQCLPGARDRFDFGGSCGHSILASIVTSSRHGWIPPMSPGARVRVRVLNNGDQVVCEVDQVHRSCATFTVHFMPPTPPVLRSLLLNGEPTTPLSDGGSTVRASLVSTGNPYVLVDAQDLGVTSQNALFADDPKLYRKLQTVRKSASKLLGFPPESAFPKVAAIASFKPGELVVRAISVPTWHPTLALTGAICVGAAAQIPGTVPHSLLGPTGGEALEILTPGGRTSVSASLFDDKEGPRLGWVSVNHKQARFHQPIHIEPLHQYVIKESERCLPLSL